ncbi:Sodium/hydrogen exchanger family [Ceratobasidium sp. AG-Ba]|nr:Sodium/hydrogen exchanger family [Ceratobasidium sp. AG-Ba]
MNLIKQQISGLVSYVVKHRLYLSEPLIALLFGIVVGPAVLGWVDPGLWRPEEDRLMGYKDSLTLALTRITIGIQVFFAGVALPKKYLKTEFQSLIMLLLPIMGIAWFVCAFLIYELIPRLTFMEALMIAACITPTDPVLANSITKGRFADQSVKPSVRNIIVAESGANDGLGYPFIFLPLFFIMARSDEEFYGPNRHLSGIIGRWIYETWLYQIVLSVILGLLIGWVARKSLRWCEERRMLDEDNFVAYGTGLSFFCLGFLGIMGSDDLLCCFIAGNSFSWDDRQRLAAEDSGFQDIIDLLLNAAIFMYIGAIMPWYMRNGFQEATLGHGSGKSIYKFIPAIPSFKEAIFVGWFGPIGVSAIFYVQVALEYLPKDSRDQVKRTVEPVVYFMVFVSILVHGITVPMTKVVVHGATLTRTLTQPNETAKPRSSLPINLDSIRRIGVAVPMPTYSAMGEQVTRHGDLDARRAGSQPSSRSHTRAGTPLPNTLEVNRDIEAAPGPEGRTVAFST